MSPTSQLSFAVTLSVMVTSACVTRTQDVDRPGTDRMRPDPSTADVTYEFDRSDDSWGSAILTVGTLDNNQDYVELVLVGLNRSLTTGRISLSDEQAAGLAGGGSIDCSHPATPDIFSAVSEDVSVGYEVTGCALEVDSLGMFTLQLGLSNGRDADSVVRGDDTGWVTGRMVAACEVVDENSIPRRVVDLSANPRCERLMGWL